MRVVHRNETREIADSAVRTHVTLLRQTLGDVGYVLPLAEYGLAGGPLTSGFVRCQLLVNLGAPSAVGREESDVELRLLGPVEVVAPDGFGDLDGVRPTRVLFALFVADHHRLTLDELGERCFSDSDRPADQTPTLRTAIRRVRRALGDDAALTRSGSYALNLAGLSVDVERFEELVAAAKATSDPVAAVSRFRQALEMWRGRPFAGYDGPWWRWKAGSTP